MKATARAHPNIAFVKYWGKRDTVLNLPQAGSLSLTLDGLGTTTTVSFDGPEGSSDEFVINNEPADERSIRKMSRIIDPLRRRAGFVRPVRVETKNDFPTGAGLASSASGLAALAVAAARAAGIDLSPTELSILARLGSGSACRSIFGGFVEWQAGRRTDGSDSHAICLYPPEHWDLRAVIAVVSEEKKTIDSTRGMRLTNATSPYQRAFVEGIPADLDEARRAIAVRDLELLARVSERSCLRMHAAMMASDPPLLYLRPESWRIMERVRDLRRRGAPIFFSADAGPNVKIFCEAGAVAMVEQALSDVKAVRRVLHGRPGPGAREVGT